VLPRVLEAEWLDELPAGDVRALRSRADLRRVNWIMGNARLIAGPLRALLPAQGSLRIADLGAGDGCLTLSVARRLRRPDVRLTLVDRAPAVHGVTVNAFAALRWRANLAAVDIFHFLSQPGAMFDAVVANLFLHHFEPERLSRLLSLIARRTRVFVACEPRRSRFALLGSRFLWALGCNDVTRHDAVVSVRAGFSDDELSRLWPSRGWKLEEKAARPFSHVFVARRDAL
jgi:SAM-dependent methyltransferase